MEGPGNILLAVRIPRSTPSANTHWQWDHTTLVALGVHTWQALEMENTSMLILFKIDTQQYFDLEQVDKIVVLIQYWYY